MFLGDLNHYVRSLAIFLEELCWTEATWGEREEDVGGGGGEEGTREEREGGSERLWNYLETEAQPS